ncbi:MAG: hypothetical protein ACOVMN_03135 [Flexibacteraceae bacterium]|jgi:ribosomal protein L22
MPTDKLKVKELTQKLQDAIAQFLATENAVASEKLKRTTHNHAKKLSKKFTQTVSKLQKKAAKNAAKLSDNNNVEIVVVGTKKPSTRKKVAPKS